MENLEQIRQDIIKNRVNKVPDQSLTPKITPNCEVHTFDNFKQAPDVQKAYDAFVRLSEVSEPQFFLVCYGGSGSGKTHLTKALVNALRIKGTQIGYLTWVRLIDSLRRALRDKEMPGLFDYQMDRYCRMPALAIDDVGMGTTETNWENAILERIIVERYEHRLLTVITTNKHIQEFPERVTARFKDRTTTMIVINRAGNYRELKGVSTNPQTR